MKTTKNISKVNTVVKAVLNIGLSLFVAACAVTLVTTQGDAMQGLVIVLSMCAACVLFLTINK